ncbi:hypothetical protein [Streptomyces sp. NPDC003877]
MGALLALSSAVVHALMCTRSALPADAPHRCHLLGRPGGLMLPERVSRRQVTGLLGAAAATVLLTLR